MSEAAAISKREQKRQEKLARQKAEKAAESTGAIEPVVTKDSSTVLPIVDETTNPKVVSEQKKSPYVEPLQKRIRAYIKKKQKLDNLLERSQDPEAKKKLDPDQLDVIARKDQILSPLKELQSLAEQLAQIDIQQSQAYDADKAEVKKTHDEALAVARQEGLTEGKKILASLISFLGYASVLRANPSPDKDFNEACEKLLTLVYVGGDESSQASVLLDSASEEQVEGTPVTYKQIYNAIYGLTPTKEPEAEPEEAPKTNGATPHFISLSDLSANPSKIVGGISFLNESEIEGVHAPEEQEAPVAQTSVPGPSQGIVNNVANKEANATTMEWNDTKNTTTTNWADESIDEVVVVPRSTPSPRKREQKGDDFKTIEGRPKSTRGGRGDRGRGRGRGEGYRRGGGDRGRGQ